MIEVEILEAEIKDSVTPRDKTLVIEATIFAVEINARVPAADDASITAVNAVHSFEAGIPNIAVPVLPEYVSPQKSASRKLTGSVPTLIL